MFLDDDVTNLESLGILTSNMQDDEEIKKGGIVIITNDIVNPRMEIKFFSRKKTRKDCTYDIKDMNEWGTIINNIAKRNR